MGPGVPVQATKQLLLVMPGTRPAPESWQFLAVVLWRVGGSVRGGGGQSVGGGGLRGFDGVGVVSSFHSFRP